MNAKLIITGQYGISCCNQIFYNLNAQIIGFQVNKRDNNIKLVNKPSIKFYIPFDKMCNSYYYHKMDKIILSPLVITKQNLKQFKNLENLYLKD